MKIVFDKYNSKIFGLKMGNIVDYNHAEDSVNLNENIKQSTFNHVSVKIDTFKKDVFNFFISNKFYLVDTNVTYKLKINKHDYEADYNVRNANFSDAEEISVIAEKSFTIDRFHSDPNLSEIKSNNYYKNWALNLLNNDDIISNVYIKDNKIAGFSFWNIQNDVSRLILVAVSKKYRRQGIYGKLIDSFLKEYSNQLEFVYMGTQIDNYHVHKKWSKLGAFIVESQYVLHRKEEQQDE